MIERIRLHSRWSVNRADALPVRRCALPSNIPVGCLYYRLQNGICGDGSTGPLICRDGAARAP
jgi:hypothetical protein